jgi:hypothetical protein
MMKMQMMWMRVLAFIFLVDLTVGVSVTCTLDYCRNTAVGVDEYICKGTRECYCGYAKSCYSTGGYTTFCENAINCTAYNNNFQTNCQNSKYCYNDDGRDTLCGNAEFCYSGGSDGLKCESAKTCMGWKNNADMYCDNAGSCVNERSRATYCGNAKSCRSFRGRSDDTYCEKSTVCINEPLRFISKEVKIGDVVFGTTQVGYAFSGPGIVFSPTPIRYKSISSIYASDQNPGDGWIGLGVVKQAFNFTLYWKNARTMLMESG